MSSQKCIIFNSFFRYSIRTRR